MTTKQLIKEYVEDHFNAFGFYPYDVEVDGQVYSYGNYWSILKITLTCIMVIDVGTDGRQNCKNPWF